MGILRNTYKILIRKPERMRLLGRPTCRSEDNIKMNLKRMGHEVVDLVQLTQDRVKWLPLVNMMVNLSVP
jgi:hypothetical protein